MSRVEYQPYAHSSVNLPALQIDAAINPGNSGGPALLGDKVVGVAFQHLQGADNIGYVIPAPVVRHFLADIERTGRYRGVCQFGFVCQACARNGRTPCPCPCAGLTRGPRRSRWRTRRCASTSGCRTP